jgi:hypothetical protein
MSAHEVRTSVVVEHCCAGNLLQRVPSRQLEPPVVIKHVVVHSHAFDVIAVHALRVCATRAVPAVVCICKRKGEREHVRASMKVRCTEDKCDARVDPHALTRVDDERGCIPNTHTRGSERKGRACNARERNSLLCASQVSLMRTTEHRSGVSSCCKQVLHSHWRKE